MVLLEPEHGIRDQKALNLGAAVIEIRRTPFPVFGALLIVRLVEGHAVKMAQSLLVLAKMSRHPVHNDGDAVRVCRIDEVAEVVRLSVAARHRIIACCLVAPRAVKGMLAKRHELDMRVVHLLRIADELVGHLTVGEILALKRAPPGAQMNLIGQHRVRIGRIRPLPLLPLRIVPLVFVEIIKTRSRLGFFLRIETIGIGLHDMRSAPLRLDGILVDLSLFKTFNECHPDLAVTDLLHPVRARVPFIEVPHNAYGFRMRRPDGKAHAFPAVLLNEVGSEHLVSMVVCTLVV